MTLANFKFFRDVQIKPKWGWPATFSCNGQHEVWPGTRYGLTPEGEREHLEGVLGLLDDSTSTIGACSWPPGGGKSQNSFFGCEYPTLAIATQQHPRSRPAVADQAAGHRGGVGSRRPEQGGGRLRRSDRFERRRLLLDNWSEHLGANGR